MTLSDESQAAPTSPLVSVIMANYRGAAYLPAALDSVLCQTIDDIEVIVSDDASPDDSAAVVRRMMARDPRVRLIVAEDNAGPAAARNRALRAAGGAWIAIVDSDDIVHPERLEILLATARRLDADALADDLLYYSGPDRGLDRTLLGELGWLEPTIISPEFFIRSNTAGSRLPPLGYLKPVFRREAIVGRLYDETVRIGEDYDFLLRFLLEGGRFFVVPEALYLYRRHPGSISHRLSEKTVDAMIASHEAFVRDRRLSPGVGTLLEKRLGALRRAASFERLVATVKRRDLGQAARQLAAQPRLVAPLSRSAAEHVRGRMARKRPAVRERTTMVLHDRNLGEPGGHPVHAAVGIEGRVNAVPVPPYRGPDSADRAVGDARLLRTRLTSMSVLPDIQVVAHGLAGLFAMSFLPNTAAEWVVVDDADELERILTWTARTPARVVVADRVLDEIAVRPPVARFCDGYREVVMREGALGIYAQTPGNAAHAAAM